MAENMNAEIIIRELNKSLYSKAAINERQMKIYNDESLNIKPKIIKMKKSNLSNMNLEYGGGVRMNESNGEIKNGSSVEGGDLGAGNGKCFNGNFNNENVNINNYGNNNVNEHLNGNGNGITNETAYGIMEQNDVENMNKNVNDLLFKLISLGS